MQKKGKVLALDYGKKRVGLATGDFEFGIAFPRAVIFNEGIGCLVDDINRFCEENGIVFIVVGLPLNMDFECEENKMIVEVKRFVEELRKKNDKNIDIELFDERLSSFEAEKFMIEANVDSGKTKLGIDAYAAQIILQRFFDKIKD